MANLTDPRMKKVNDSKSIYYHCMSLKKHLSKEDQELMQPLENSLKQQDKLKPPYGYCYHCKDPGHWLSDCPEGQNYREQQLSSTEKKSPPYGHCYLCGLTDHWAPQCPKKDEDFSSDQPSTSTVSEKPSRKRKASESFHEPPAKRRRLIKKTRTGLKDKTSKKKFCFICKSDDHRANNCSEIILKDSDKGYSGDNSDNDH